MEHTTNDDTALETKNVVKRFPGVTAVDNVSLIIKKGEVFSLLGPSGCGKTTFMNLVAGLEQLDGGEIVMEGKVINDIPPHKRKCSMIFQRLALFPHMTVEQNIAFGLEQHKVPKGEIRKKISYILDLVKLAGYEKRRPHQLSGGQQQRVAMARSLVLNPALLLLDEPLSSLDRKLRKDMQIELKRIQREVNVTFIYVTHDQKEALCLSDRIGVMREGKIVQIGSPVEIYETPKTKFVADFLGATNIFSGKIVKADNEKVQIETEKGLRIMVRNTQGQKVGEIADLAVRPELIELFSPDADIQDLNVFKAKVIEIIYQGEFSEMQILLEGVERPINAHVTTQPGLLDSLAPDDEILVHWKWHKTDTLAPDN